MEMNEKTSLSRDMLVHKIDEGMFYYIAAALGQLRIMDGQYIATWLTSLSRNLSVAEAAKQNFVQRDDSSNDPCQKVKKIDNYHHTNYLGLYLGLISGAFCLVFLWKVTYLYEIKYNAVTVG